MSKRSNKEFLLDINKAIGRNELSGFIRLFGCGCGVCYFQKPRVKQFKWVSEFLLVKQRKK